LADSTALLKPLLAGRGALTKRKPDADEEKDATTAGGSRTRWRIWTWDKASRCLAALAWPWRPWKDRRDVARRGVSGERAAVETGEGVTASRHLLFDVPVAGPTTIDVMRETGTTLLAVDAGRTLLIDREEMLASADEAGIAVVGY